MQPSAEPSQIPHDIAAEETVLGGILVHGKKFTEANALVTAEDFYHPLHVAIFAAMVALDESGEPIDPVTVHGKIGARKFSHDVPNYLAGLMATVVNVENIAHHARQVRSRARRRKLLLDLRTLCAKGVSDASDAEFLQHAERTCLEILSTPTGGKVPRSGKQVMRSFVGALEKRFENKGVLSGVSTGFPGLDKITGGFQSKELTIVAARPSMGKTAWALNVAARAQVPVLFFSLEMGEESLSERLIAMKANINSMKLRTADLDIAEWKRVHAATSDIAESTLWVDDEGGISIPRLRSKARRWRGTVCPSGNALIVVDYLQLVSGGKRYEKREQEVAAVSSGLKLLAKELDAPVLALAQLSRALETRSDKRPILSDLRESGSIEQDGDLIGFLYRHEVYFPDEHSSHGKAELILGKNRNGPVGVMHMDWQPKCSRFTEERTTQ